MTATEIAAALGGKREGREWRCPCPVHGGRSLTLTEGRDGKLLIHCFGGCESREVFDELRSLGLIGGDPGAASQERYERWRQHRWAEVDRQQRSVADARRLWESAGDACGTPTERYLEGRGIDVLPLGRLRWVASCPHPGGSRLPAMIARIDNIDGELIGVHRTFLKPDGSGKADAEPQKAMIGRAMGGAVRLGAVRPDHWLVIGEGIESTASAMQLWTSPSGWGALSASGLRNLILPPEARRVLICADNDENGVGQAAARDAAWVCEEGGRVVRVPRSRSVPIPYLTSIVRHGGGVFTCSVASSARECGLWNSESY
jgi:putative DNA primase/helicase